MVIVFVLFLIEEDDWLDWIYKLCFMVWFMVWLFLLLLLLFSEKRQAEAARIREKYPDRIPVRSCSTVQYLFVMGLWCLICLIYIQLTLSNYILIGCMCCNLSYSGFVKHYLKHMHVFVYLFTMVENFVLSLILIRIVSPL